MVRKNLAKYYRQKIKVRATIDRFGTKTNWKTGAPEQTMCLVDIVDKYGNLLTDHVWFTVRKKFEKLNLKPGDKIVFFSTVTGYMKGYEKDQFDYKLSYPGQIHKISYDYTILDYVKEEVKTQ